MLAIGRALDQLARDSRHAFRAFPEDDRAFAVRDRPGQFFIVACQRYSCPPGPSR